MYTYTYIEREGERWRQRDGERHGKTSIFICRDTKMRYMYTHTHIIYYARMSICAYICISLYTHLWFDEVAHLEPVEPVARSTARLSTTEVPRPPASGRGKLAGTQHCAVAALTWLGIGSGDVVCSLFLQQCLWERPRGVEILAGFRSPCERLEFGVEG